MNPSISPSAPFSEVSTRAWTALGLWSAGALALGASGLVAALPRPLIPALIWSPVIAFAALYRRGGGVRAFVDGVDLRLPVLFHAVRVVFGALFLVDAARGELPRLFAQIAGPGDLVAGTLALPAAWLAGRRSRGARAALLAWNVFGLVDILAVFFTAQRLLFIDRDPLMLQAFQRMPYPTLPLLVVPLVLITHGAVFLRLRAWSRRAG
ncbi:MAG: hypothetical protein R3A48_23990 [Polyangiales bacterium]